MKPLIAPLLMFVFMVTLRHAPGIPTYSDYYGQTLVIVTLSVLVALLLTALVWHYILWGGFRDCFTRRTALTPYIIILAVGLVLNGLGAPGYTIRDTLFGCLLVFCWILLYLVFLRGLPHGKKTVEYFCICCQWVAVLLIAELMYICATQDVIIDGIIYKNSIMFGWGVNNNFGGILAWLLPPLFYLAATRRNGWIQLLLSVLVMVSIFFSMSRSALLVGAVIYLICLVAVCLVGQNKGLFRMFSLVLVCGVGIYLLFRYDNLMRIFRYYSDRGLTDSGRFELWENGLEVFRAHPIFGGGFHASPFDSWAGRAFGFVHNTVIQLLCAGGIVCTGAYLAYRAKTVWIVLNKMTVERFFLGMTLAALLGVSLLDNHMFNIYPSFFYAIALALAENDYHDRVVSPGDGSLPAEP